MNSMESMMEAASESFRNGDYFRADALYSGVIQAQPNNFKALSNRSAARLKLGDATRALEDARKCTTVSPSFVKGWGRLGAALHTLKHYEDAIAAYERAAALDASNASYKEALTELRGLVQSGRGVASDAGRAEYYFRRSIDQGVKAMKDGQNEEAVRHFTKAMAQTPACDAEMHILLANRSAAYLKLGQTLEALDDANEAVRLRPDYARGHVRLAAAASARGNLDDAQRAITTALEADPTNAAAKEIAAQVAEKRAQAAKVDEARRAQSQADRDALAKAASLSGDAAMEGPNSRAAPAASQASAQGFVPSLNRHTVSYAHCRLCSENGHTARDCPLRVKRM